MTPFAQCDGAEIPLCRSCRRHADNNGPRDPFQPVIVARNRGPQCIDWLPVPAQSPRTPPNFPRTDTGD